MNTAAALHGRRRPGARRPGAAAGWRNAARAGGGAVRVCAAATGARPGARALGIPLPPYPAPAVAAASPPASTPARLRATHFQVTQTEVAAGEGEGVAQLAGGEVLTKLPQSDPGKPPPALVPLWPEGALRRLLRRSLRAPLATAQLGHPALDNPGMPRRAAAGPPAAALPPELARRDGPVHSRQPRVARDHADLQAVVHQALRSSAGVARVYWLDEEGQCWSAQWCGERKPPRWQRVVFAAAASRPAIGCGWVRRAALEPAGGGRWSPRLRQHLQRGGGVVWLRPGPALSRPLRGVPVAALGAAGATRRTHR